MSRGSVPLRSALLAAMLVAAASVALAGAKPGWDRAANVREVAQRLVTIQDERGALGTFKFIAACYQTHMIAEAFNKALEACIAQDYMLTQTLVLIYERLPPEKRKAMSTAEPAQLARAMSGRVGAVLAHYKMTEGDGEELRRIVEKEGFPVFFKERFPKAKQ